MESIEHLELKRLAVAWLARLGCRAIATEVRCPIAKYRVDAAGWLDHADGSLLDAGGLEGRKRRVDATLFGGSARGTARRGPARPRTIVIECKQSRADFVRDDHDAERLKRKLEMLRRTRNKFERDLIPGSEPHLRESGSALFPEMETWDFEGSRTSSYRRCLRETERIERRLHGETKFHTMPRYRLADHFYLFTPTGLLKPHEVPTGWGLVECGRPTLRRGAGSLTELDALPLAERIACPSADAPDERRQRLLRNIAVAASRSIIEEAARAPATPTRRSDATSRSDRSPTVLSMPTPGRVDDQRSTTTDLGSSGGVR